MVVKTQCRGHRITGLNVGASNARRYFPRHSPSIDLELGHLHIQCVLPPEFWDGHPEIHDPRLSDWLEAAHLRSRPAGVTMSLELTHVGRNSFRLQTVEHRPSSSMEQPKPTDAEPVPIISS